MKSSKRLRIQIEVGVVLALSLGASAVYSIVSLLAKLTADTGLSNQTTTLNPQLSERQWLDFSYQFLGIALGLAPVALVLYLLWEKKKSPFDLIGLNLNELGRDIWRGTWIAALIGIPGLGLYLVSRQLGISAEVIPAAVGEYWWAIPMLLFAAVRASLIEEVIVIGYFFNRLSRLGFSIRSQILLKCSFTRELPPVSRPWWFYRQLLYGVAFWISLSAMGPSYAPCGGAFPIGCGYLCWLFSAERRLNFSLRKSRFSRSAIASRRAMLGL